MVFLIENSGRAVSKQELMNAVWKDTFVSEDNLTQAILKIRRTLGDDTGHSQFIQTIPRVGYRFIGLGAPSEPTPVRRRFWLPAAGLLLALAGVAGLWLAGRIPTARAPAAVPLEIPLPTASSTKPVFAPDGSQFLYVGFRNGIADLYLASLSGSSVRRITEGLDPRGDHPMFTPDGREVVFARWRSGDDGTRWPDLWVAPAAGGWARLLIEQASGAGFSLDGRWIGYTKHLPGGKALWISPRNDLEQRREIGPLGFTPRWSRDGKWIAYTTSNPEGGLGELWIASADLSVRKRLTSQPEQFYGIAWMPDSRWLVFAADRGGGFSVWRTPIEGGPRTVLAGGVGTYAAPSVSPDGRVLLFSHVLAARDLFYSDRIEGGREVQLTSGQYHLWPALAPSGRRVATVLRTPGFGDRVYVTSVDSAQTLRLSDRPAAYPAWLDGGRVAYLHADAAGGTDVRVAAVPSGPDRSLCRFPEPASWLAVHPDGQRIAVVLTAPDRRQRIVVRDLAAQRDTTLAEGEEYEHLRWVPGGNSFSWSGPLKSAGPRSDGIWVAEPGGAAPKHLVPDGYSPVWNDDGTMVYYSRIGDHAGLWRFDLRSGEPVRVRNWTEVEYFDASRGHLVFGRIASATHVFRLPLD